MLLVPRGKPYSLKAPLSTMVDIGAPSDRENVALSTEQVSGGRMNIAETSGGTATRSKDNNDICAPSFELNPHQTAVMRIGHTIGYRCARRSTLYAQIVGEGARQALNSVYKHGP